MGKIITSQGDCYESGSSIQGGGAFYSGQRVDQAARIRFENALAAARTVDKGDDGQNSQHIDQVDFASALPTSKHPSAIPGAKMIQSLNKLVQNNPTENYGGLDIRQ